MCRWRAVPRWSIAESHVHRDRRGLVAKSRISYYKLVGYSRTCHKARNTACRGGRVLFIAGDHVYRGSSSRVSLSCHSSVKRLTLKFSNSYNFYSVSQKKFPLRFSEIFSQTVGNFNQFFTHLLYDHFFTRVQIFIQISPTLTKLCHIKCDHLAKFYISLEL